MRYRLEYIKNLKCPFCGHQKLRKSGFTYDRKGEHRRYFCYNPDCGKRTIKPVRVK